MMFEKLECIPWNIFVAVTEAVSMEFNNKIQLSLKKS